MRKRKIDREYELLGRTSRSIRFEAREAMGPTISGVKRSLLIPPYSRKSSSMIKAYRKLNDALKLSIES